MWNVGPPGVFASLTAHFRFDLEWMLLAFVLVGLILLGIGVVIGFKRWQAGQQESTLGTRIEDYRALLEKGLLDPQEFERLRDRLEKEARADSVPPTSPKDQPDPP